MSIQEKVKKAQNTLSEKFSFTTVEVSNWRNERVYINRPDQSQPNQAVGYVRISDGKIFPAFGTKCRTERDRDAQKMLDCVSEIIIDAEAQGVEVQETYFRISF